MSPDPAAAAAFPLPLSDYPAAAASLVETLSTRVAIEPFNAVATGIFVLAILHTFGAARFAKLAHRIQHARNESAAREGRTPRPSVRAELLHFLGEVEVVFGLWAVVLIIALTSAKGWEAAKHYFNDTVVYTEPLFVIVIMALASTRPVIGFAEAALRRVANLGGGTPAAWWVAILTVGPVLGSFITEPAAMTICALLLARQFFDLASQRRPEVRDARPVVRQRVDRRHAHALCGAAGPDGGARVGLGHCLT